MKALVTAALLILFLLIAAPGGALADDYFKNAFAPEGADDRSSQLYPAYDFEDVMFSREYFYTLEEGKAQYDRWAEARGRRSISISGSSAAAKTVPSERALVFREINLFSASENLSW